MHAKTSILYSSLLKQSFKYSAEYNKFQNKFWIIVIEDKPFVEEVQLWSNSYSSRIKYKHNETEKNTNEDNIIVEFVDIFPL